MSMTHSPTTKETLSAYPLDDSARHADGAQNREELVRVSWSDWDFFRLLKQRNCIGSVAEVDGGVAGYMVYSFFQRHIHLENFVVGSWAWRRGIGSQMIAKLIGKLSEQRRRRIICEIRESNLPAELFSARWAFTPWPC